MRPNTASGLLQIGHELEKRQWRHNLLTWRHCRIFFDVVLFLLSSLVSAVMDSFFYKGLTRNPRIRNTPVWVFPNIWRLGRVRDTKLVMVVSNKVLPNAAKCQGYSFYCFWVIKRKPTGWGERKITPSPPPRSSRLGLKMMKNDFYFILKALFVLKIFKLLSWIFWSCRKTAW